MLSPAPARVLDPHLDPVQETADDHGGALLEDDVTVEEVAGEDEDLALVELDGLLEGADVGAAPVVRGGVGEHQAPGYVALEKRERGVRVRRSEGRK